MKISTFQCLSVVLAAAIVLWPFELRAAADEDFEQGIVPDGWTSNQKNCLSVIDNLQKGGRKSLLWKWEYSSNVSDTRTDIQAYLQKYPTHFGLNASYFHDNILSVRFDAPLEKSGPGQGLSLWCYCRRPGCVPMLRLEILGGDKVVGRGWYKLYPGWRRLSFPYRRTRQGPITGFRLLAPTNYPPQWPYNAPEYLCLDDVETNASKTTYNGEEIESLDGTTLPEGWKADSSGRLTMCANRRKSGDASLLWTWDRPGASLVYTNPLGFERINKWQCFAFWVHNAPCSPKKLRLELLGKGKTLGGCWYTLDFEGWHVLAAPYEQIGWNGVDHVDSVRLSAPDDKTRGRLHLDFVNLTCIGEGGFGYRPATPCADFAQPWMGKPDLLKNPEKCLYSKRDISVNRPWLPPPVSADAITPRQMADMEKLRGPAPPPFPLKQTGSIAPKRIEEIESLMEHWGIEEADGVVSGRPIASRLNSPPEAFHVCYDFNELLNRSINAHWDARRIGDTKSAARLLKISRRLLDFAADQGMFSCSDNFNTLSLELVRCEGVATAETFSKLLYCAFFGIGGGLDICKEEPSGDTDIILGYYSRLPRIISMFSDPAERLQKLQAFVRGINRICERVNLDPFGPDGTAFHHRMHHWSYASYEIPVLLHIAESLNKTSFQLDPAVNASIKKWIFTMAWSACKYTMPSSLQARSGDICTLNMAEPARRLAECGSADGRESIDRELASLFLALTDKPDSEAAKKYRGLGIRPYQFSGHRVLNGAATSIHRRDDWMVAVIGMNKHVRGLEIYGGEKNSSSRFAHNGALSVVSSGNPVSCQASGWNFDGWNSFHYPGVTNPLSADQQSIQSNYYLLANASAFAGGTDLEGDGIWGYEHRSQGMRCNKSVFFSGKE